MAAYQDVKVLRPAMNIIKMNSVPILKQLLLEERLLRNSNENWCIFNDGTSQPTIVMGISGKPSQLINLKPVIRDQIPVIRRFSGGGTVIVNDETIFVTLICNRGALPSVQPYPQSIMSWSGELYGEVFRCLRDFKVQENDYVFGTRKFGGNAQSITKARWLHHTSFLWDYDMKNMDYLKQPPRAPKYRSARSHSEFLCKMREVFPSKLTFVEKTTTALGSYFSVCPVDIETANNLSGTSSSTSTRMLTPEELEEACFASIGGVSVNEAANM